MMSVPIKISDDNYEQLCILSGKLQAKIGKPILLNEAISYLCKKKPLSDLAGLWNMSEKEEKKFINELKLGWAKWEKRYV